MRASRSTSTSSLVAALLSFCIASANAATFPAGSQSRAPVCPILEKTAPGREIAVSTTDLGANLLLVAQVADRLVAVTQSNVGDIDGLLFDPCSNHWQKIGNPTRYHTLDPHFAGWTSNGRLVIVAQNPASRGGSMETVQAASGPMKRFVPEKGRGLILDAGATAWREIPDVPGEEQSSKPYHDVGNVRLVAGRIVYQTASLRTGEPLNYWTLDPAAPKPIWRKTNRPAAFMTSPAPVENGLFIKGRGRDPPRESGEFVLQEVRFVLRPKGPIASEIIFDIKEAVMQSICPPQVPNTRHCSSISEERITVSGSIRRR